MQIHIAENIRAERKARSLTQEQLAEALGVTVGAVSKWESGASVPEIGLIVRLAEFFETSVDVLLGYDWRGGGMGLAVERIRALRNEKRFDEATVEAEKALLKYPNSFVVVYGSALQYSLKGVERRCKKSYARALTLFERALELIAQNTDEHINEWTIRNNIADVTLCLGKTERALELLKKNNADGLNDGEIGYLLACEEHKPEEALPYLSNALIHGLTQMFRSVTGYFNAYCDLKDHDSALAVMQWMLSVMEGLKPPDRSTYLDMQAAQLLTGCALASALKGDAEAAEEYLRQAMEQAARFDATPCYQLTGIRFVQNEKSFTAFDDFGGTATEGIGRTLTDNGDDAAALLALWQSWQRKKQ